MLYADVRSKGMFKSPEVWPVRQLSTPQDGREIVQEVWYILFRNGGFGFGDVMHNEK